MKLFARFTTVTTLSKTLALILFVFLPFIGFYFGNKYNPNKYVIQSSKLCSIIPTNCPANELIDTTSESWVKPSSSDKAIPIVKGGVLYWFSLTNQQLNKTKYKTSWGSGTSGLGSVDPLSSPDGKFIAFINKDDNSSLYILPSGSQIATRITDYPVKYLNSWSSDSSKLLFYSEQDSLRDRKFNDMGGNLPWDEPESFNKNLVTGFYLFNIDNGSNMLLSPLTSVDQFIDANQIAVELYQDLENKQKRLVLFNVDTFTADFSTINYVINSFSDQRSFSANGKYWAKTVGGDSSSNVQIVFSKFPDNLGVIVDSASWGNIQKPLLNVSGRYLAYTKKSNQNTEGQQSDKTIIWDTSLKKIIKEQDGWPEYWVDENTILIGRIAGSGSNPAWFTSFNLFHVDTQQTDSIPIN